MTTSTEVFSKVIKIQLIAVVILAAIVMLIFNLNACISVMLGGGSVMLGSFLASLVSKRSVNQQDATAVLLNLLKAEAVKIVVILVLLFLVFKFYIGLVPFALISGLAITAIFSGAALSKLNV
jgi:ATP synthase protein I